MAVKSSLFSVQSWGQHNDSVSLWEDGVLTLSDKVRCLVVTSHYLPGYKAGGPIRSVANLVELLGDELSFLVVTSDRDFGDDSAYPGIVPNRWNCVGKAQVMYVSPEYQSLGLWSRLLSQAKYDLIHLNSFFSIQTRYTLFLRRLHRVRRCPVILAPRGEFSPGALGLKPRRKQAYIQIALRLGLYRDLIWHATSESEQDDIQRVLSPYIKDLSSRTYLAPNLTAPMPTESRLIKSCLKQTHVLRLVFLSRIARKKNLDFALKALQGLEGSVVFDIYGPIEDQQYWEECGQIIRSMPSNIQVNYGGAVTPDEILNVLAGSHLFFLPTRGENFGHVIIEAWIAGLPVLISDQTPWRDLAKEGVGWDISLSQLDYFRKILQKVCDMDQAEFSVLSQRSRQFAINFMQVQQQANLLTHRQLFEAAISK